MTDKPVLAPTEREAWRAEVDHLHEVIAKYVGEIERLRIELHRVAESRRGQRERSERAEAEIEWLRAAIRLALQYTTAGGHEYIATADDAQAAVNTLLAALDGPKDGYV